MDDPSPAGAARAAAGSGSGRAALAGIRVLDASRGTAGPLAAMLFADFGAEVLKPEPPGGDPGRDRPEWAVWNRGKTSVILDPTSTAGRRDLESLVAGADVLVVDGPGGAEAGGRPEGPLDPARAVAAHDRLVALQVPGCASTTPWSGDPESHGLLHAYCGLALNQACSGEGPVDVIAQYLLVIHGIWAAACAAAALVERAGSGRGQVVTVSGMHAAAVAAVSYYTADPTAPPRRRPPVGGPGGSLPYYRLYRCADGESIFVAGLTEEFTRRAFDLAGVSWILDDERLGPKGRYGLLEEANAEWAIAAISEAFATRPAAEWLAALAAVGCPASAVMRRDDWLDHPQVRALGLRVEVDDPVRGRTVMPGVPVGLSATPGAVRAPAPAPAPPGAPVTWTNGSGADRTGPEADDRGSSLPIGADGRGPLGGVRVLDLGSVLAGPFAGSLLAELGADVIKVEPPGGESYRGAFFTPYNKGQRSVALDLRAPAGLATFLDLARAADVVIDNYRPGVVDRLHIGYADLRVVNPGVVSVSISGFGEDGPLGGSAGYDPILQSMSGMVQAQGGADDPVLTSIPSNDVAAAVSAAFGAVVALVARPALGSGQRVTTTLASMATLIQARDLVRFAGRPAPAVGAGDFAGPDPTRSYHRTGDGWLRIEAPGVPVDDIVAILGKADPERDGDGPGGPTGLAAALRGLTAERAATLLNDAGVPAVRARRIREVITDPALAGDGIFRPYPLGGFAHWVTPGEHARFSRTPPPPTRPAPRLAEHTTDALAAAGVGPERIAALLRDGVCVQAPADLAPLTGLE